MYADLLLIAITSYTCGSIGGLGMFLRDFAREKKKNQKFKSLENESVELVKVDSIDCRF